MLPVPPVDSSADYTVPHLPNPGADAPEAEDVDLIWGGESDDVPNREWSKLDEDFTNVRTRCSSHIIASLAATYRTLYYRLGIARASRRERNRRCRRALMTALRRSARR